MTLTTSMVNTSTATIPALDISDAYRIGGVITGATTAPGLQLEVAMLMGTSAAFVPLSFITSGNSPMYFSSATAIQIPTIAAAQIRPATTSASGQAAAATIQLVKFVQI